MRAGDVLSTENLTRKSDCIRVMPIVLNFAHFVRRGDKMLSEKKFREALELNSENVRTLSLYGCFCHTGLRDYDLAKTYYEKASMGSCFKIIVQCAEI